jgi:hypothetical protein
MIIASAQLHPRFDPIFPHRVSEYTFGWSNLSAKNALFQVPLSAQNTSAGDNRDALASASR